MFIFNEFHTILLVMEKTSRYEVHSISFQIFFVWALLLTVDTKNSSALQSILLRHQCTCCTVPTTSGKSPGSFLVSVFRTLVTASFMSSIASEVFLELWEYPKVAGSKVRVVGMMGSHLDAHLGLTVCDEDGDFVDWGIVLMEMPLT